MQKQWTWDAVAERIGISVSMLYQVKRGDCQLSPKALFRLEVAERAEGLRPMWDGQMVGSGNSNLLKSSDEVLSKRILEIRQQAKQAREFAGQQLAFAEEMERAADLVEKFRDRRNKSKRDSI